MSSDSLRMSKFEDMFLFLGASNHLLYIAFLQSFILDVNFMQGGWILSIMYVKKGVVFVCNCRFSLFRLRFVKNKHYRKKVL